MKRFKLFLASVALPLFGWAAGAKQVPYSTDFSDFADWTIINVKEGSSTWNHNNLTSNYSGAGASQGIWYKFDSKNPGDDWCISPAIHLEAGKEYKMKAWEKTSGSDKENFKYTISSGNTAETMAAGTDLIVHENYSNNKWNKVSKVFTVETTGDYHLGIYCYSEKFRYNIYITNVSIGENIILPAAPSGLTATADANHALKVDLSWTLPTTDDDGAKLTTPLTGVEIHRDGSLIKTLTADATSFIDDESTGLSSGFHEYQICVLMGDKKSALSPAVKTKYVGPIAAQAIPWTSDLSTKDIFEATWTVIKGKNSTATNGWTFETSSYSGNSAKFAPGSNKREDDWLLSPPVKFEKAGAYKVVLNLKYTNSKTNFEVWLGNGYKITDFTKKIGTITQMTSSAADYSFVVTVDTPGEYHLGIHANAEVSASYSTYNLYYVKVDEQPIKPAQVNDLTATINGDKIDLAWTYPAKTNADTDLNAIIKAEITRTGTVVATIDNPAPGSAASWSDNNPENGFNTYAVIIYGGNGAADGTPATATSDWFGDPTQPLPYSFNFKTGNKALFNLYTVVDANNDGFTWTLSNNGVTLKMNSTEEFSTARDYLVTPPFNMEEGYYKVTYTTRAQKGTSVALGLVSDIDNTTGSFSQQDVYKPTSSYESTATSYVHITAAGKQHLAWKVADSFAKSDVVYIVNVNIEKIEIVPGVATDLKVTPDPGMALAATFEWKNPQGTNVEGVTTVLTKAIVYRNGIEIATITDGLAPGKITTYADNDVPNAGHYTYSVEVYNATGKSESKAPSIDSPWIGAGIDVPYTADFNNWTIHNVNNDKNKWEDPITWTAQPSGASISCTSNNTAPVDYAVSERINFVPKHVYDISFSSYTGIGNEPPYTWHLTQGADTGYESQSLLAEIVTTKKEPSNAQTTTLSFRAVEDGDENGADGFDGTIPAGVRCIGFHAFNKGAISVKNFSIVENVKSSVSSICKDNGYAIIGGRLAFGNVAESVTIHDVSGKVVIAATGIDSIDINGLAGGAYIFRASVGGRIIVGKFVK